MWVDDPYFDEYCAYENALNDFVYALQEAERRMENMRCMCGKIPEGESQALTDLIARNASLKILKKIVLIHNLLAETARVNRLLEEEDGTPPPHTDADCPPYPYEFDMD